MSGKSESALSDLFELYTKIGTGRPAPNNEYQPTTTYKGRVKESIEFVAAKSVDISRKDEVENLKNFMKPNRHPNIVRFYNWYQTFHHIWVVVEYCPGGTLLDLLLKDNRLPEPIVRIFASDIIDALFFLHTRGIILRDMQPRNILIDECGSIKISDFTKAMSLENPSPLIITDREADQDMIEYLAPELHTEDGESSFNSDLWSVGALMYRMASGSVPFKSPKPNESPLFTDEPPPSLVGYSSEFNNLIQGLLQKDINKRIKWEDVLKHPFWKNILKNRPKNSPTVFDINLLPRMIGGGDGRLSSSRRVGSMVIHRTNNDSARVSTKNTPKNIEALMMSSNWFDIKQIFLNKSIEDTNIPKFTENQIKITSSIESDDKEERRRAFQQVFDHLTNPNLPGKEKYPYISYTIKCIENYVVADTIVEMDCFIELLQCSLQLMKKIPQNENKQKKKTIAVVCGFLLIFSGVLRFAKNIPPKSLSDEALMPLVELFESGEERVINKVLMILGEAVYYIASSDDSQHKFPSFTLTMLYKTLQSKEETIKHYSIRIIANLLSPSDNYGLKVKELFQPYTTLRDALIDFDFGNNQKLINLYAICLCELSRLCPIPPTDRVKSVVQTLMTIDNSRTLGLMLATAIHSIDIVKKDLGRCLHDSESELNIKALLAVCLSYQDDLHGFINNIALRFFNVIDKNAQSDEAIEQVAKWTAQIAKKVIESDDTSLYQIIIQALPVKVCCEKIWTPQFEDAFRKKLISSDFTNPESYKVLQVLEEAINQKICSIELVTCISKAFESSNNDIRYLSLKILADTFDSQNVPELADFVINNVLPIVPKTLENYDSDKVIADQVLKILVLIAESCPDYVPRIATSVIMPLVFARASQSLSALYLTYQIIKKSGETIDSLVNAGLLDAICKTAENPGFTESFDLLFSVLQPISKELRSNTSSMVYEAIEMIARLSSLAKCCAERMFLVNDSKLRTKIASCLHLEIYLFSYVKSSSKCIYSDCFPPLADRINEALSKSQSEWSLMAKDLKKVLEMLSWVVGEPKISELTKAAIMDCEKLQQALQNAAAGDIEFLRKPSQEILSKLM